MQLHSSFTDASKPRGSVLLAHGYAEHQGRYLNLKNALNAAGFDAWSFDFTGHGTAQGPRARADVGALIGEHLEARKELESLKRTQDVFLFGHSMGGLITLASTLLSPPHITAVAVTGPAVRPLPKVALPLARVASGLTGVFPALTSVQLDDTLISRDPAVIEAYRNDPLVHSGKVPLRTAASMIIQGNQVIVNAPILARPTLILHGSEDKLADPGGSQEFAAAAPDYASLELIDDAYHELLNEPDHATYEARIIDWFTQWQQA